MISSKGGPSDLEKETRENQREAKKEGELGRNPRYEGARDCRRVLEGKRGHSTRCSSSVRTHLSKGRVLYFLGVG